MRKKKPPLRQESTHLPEMFPELYDGRSAEHALLAHLQRTTFEGVEIAFDQKKIGAILHW
jgi:hypothetical protein